jgi:hypothetical protein
MVSTQIASRRHALCPNRRWWCPCGFRLATVPLVRTVRAINDFVRAVLSTVGTLAPSSVLRVLLSGVSYARGERRTVHAARREYLLRCTSFTARRMLPRASCIVPRAHCMVHACSEIPTSIVRRAAVAVASPACGSCSEARGMPMHRASGCCSRAVAAARTAPRLGWGTQRHSATSAAPVLGRQRPSEPQYPAASPQRHGTPQRHVIPRRHGIPQRFGISQRHGMPWDGFDRSCHIRGRTSDVERGSTGNGCGRERAMRAHGCPCSSSGCNNRMSTETTIW